MTHLTYRIARNGTLYGPYSLPELERHMRSGHVVATDLVQPEGGDEWLPVAELFPAESFPPARPLPGGLPALYPDPPDLRWWAIIPLSIVTLGIFSTLWDVWQALWLRRIHRRSIALYLYLGAVVLFFLKLPATVEQVLYNIGFTDVTSSSTSWSLVFITLTLAISSRFVFRSELLDHFNRTEPIGLSLNPILTLIFGGLYFQYSFNRINHLKRTLRISVPSA